MYVQITTKCNMKCAHCCFAATRSGAHMELNVFQKALSIAVNRGNSFTIGGGEPTMHPRFFEYLKLVREESLRGNFEISPFMATNGKAYGKASRLLDILEDDYEVGDKAISVNLSQDDWHEPIDRRIIERKISEYMAPQIKSEPHFGSNIKKLKGYSPETWRYRIGRYRLFYIIDEQDQIISLLSIDQRKDAY